jgi:hypothetical protein
MSSPEKPKLKAILKIEGMQGTNGMADRWGGKHVKDNFGAYR